MLPRWTGFLCVCHASRKTSHPLSGMMISLQRIHYLTINSFRSAGSWNCLRRFVYSSYDAASSYRCSFLQTLLFCVVFGHCSRAHSVVRDDFQDSASEKRETLERVGAFVGKQEMCNMHMHGMPPDLRTITFSYSSVNRERSTHANHQASLSVQHAPELCASI